MNPLIEDIKNGKRTTQQQTPFVKPLERLDVDILWRSLCFARNHGKVSSDEYEQVSRKFA